MQEKPIMYKNSIKKEIHNNMNIYNGWDNNIIIKNNNIRKKINEILNSDNFIYSKMVNIVTSNEVIKRKIIGIYGNSLVTIDKEYIPIDNIKDIYI